MLIKKLVFYLELVVIYLFVIICSINGRWSSNYRSAKSITTLSPKVFKIGAILDSTEKVGQFFQAIEDVNLEPNILPPGVSLYAVSIPYSFNSITMMKNFCEKMIKSQVYAVVDDSFSPEANVIPQTCDFLKIPVIGLSNRMSYLLDTHMHSVYLRTVPPYSHQVDVWIELLKRLNYSHVVFIHSADYNGRTTFARFQSLADKNGIQIRSIVEYEPGVTDIVNELEEIDQEIQCRVYLLYVNQLEAQSIFMEIRQLNMTDPGYVWIVSETALQAGNVPDGVLALRLFNASNGNGHILDSVYIVGMAIKEMFKNENITLPPSSCGDVARNQWSTGTKFFNYLRKQSLVYGKTGRVAFDGKGDRIDADYEIINRVHGRSIIVGQYAFAPAKMKMQLLLDDHSIQWPGHETVKPLGYLRPSHLTVVTLKEEPFIFAKPVSSTDQCVDESIPCAKYDSETGLTRDYCCSGYCVDILKELSIRLNFTYTLYQVTDGAYGDLEYVDGPDKPKRWTGLVGDLLEKKADMIIAAFTINPERSCFIEFTKPFKYQGITILEKKVPKRAGLASFLQPFEESLWLLVILSVHIVALALYLLDRFSPFGRYKLPNNDVTEEDALNLSSAIWYSWGVLLNSGIGEGTPRSFGGRVLGVVWLGFAMITIASYTANLAAFLVLERPKTSLSGINDARLRGPTSTFTYATIKGSSVEMYFKRQIELKTMYQFMMDRNYKTVEDGIAAVKGDEVSALFWDSSRLEWEAARDCDLITAAEQFGRSGYGVGLRKNSYWTDQMNSVILSMHESGFMTYLDEKWILLTQQDSNSCLDSDSIPATLGLRNMAGVFILLGCGIIGGIALIVIEVVYKKRQNKEQRQLEAARGALDRWKRLVDRRRLYNEALRQIRKEHFRQQQLRRRNHSSADHVHFNDEQAIQESEDGDLFSSKNGSHRQLKYSLAHLLPQTSDRFSSDNEGSTDTSPFTVERGLSEMKLADRGNDREEIAFLDISRQSGSSYRSATSGRKEIERNGKNKKSMRFKETKKVKKSDIFRKRHLTREESINLEIGSTSDSLIIGSNESPGHVKPSHGTIFQSTSDKYTYSYQNTA